MPCAIWNPASCSGRSRCSVSSEGAEGSAAEPPTARRTRHSLQDTLASDGLRGGDGRYSELRASSRPTLPRPARKVGCSARCAAASGAPGGCDQRVYISKRKGQGTIPKKSKRARVSPTLLVRSPRHPCAMEPQMPPPRIDRTFSSPRSHLNIGLSCCRTRAASSCVGSDRRRATLKELQDHITTSASSHRHAASFGGDRHVC